MKILITGATGFIGSAVAADLLKAGHELHVLSRSPKKVRDRLGGNVHPIQGDLENALPDLGRLGQIDAVIHLAGENIAGGRWSPAAKQHILRSRELGTQNLVGAIARLKLPPRVFVSASAVGFYGSRGDEVLSESSPRGQGFLAEVCERWEAPLSELNPDTRQVILRIGVVLDEGGGLIEKLAPVFRAGAGGKAGSGKHWISWIHRLDLVRLIHRALTDSRIEGVVNAAAPEPVRNETFAHEMGTLLHRPTFLSVPEFALKLAFGEMAEEVMLASQRVDPSRLKALKFDYAFPSLESALKDILKA